MPTVAIIGRTNVGKSTLFNRLLEQPKALVSPIAGTTRDRNEGICVWRGKSVRVIDTGGLMDEKTSDVIEQQMIAQAKKAFKEADATLFVVDAKTGPMPQDKPIADILNKGGMPVLVVANKAETAAERAAVDATAWHLKGLGHPLPISATRGTGVGDLLDRLFELLESTGHAPLPFSPLVATRVAVIGKPNVGKSTLLNAIIGAERFVTSPIAHTTREPNDTLVRVGDKSYVLIDTAGMRKKSKVKKAGGLEAEAVKRNEDVIRRADVALLVVDATEPIGAQEKTLAGFLKNARCGIVVIVNKWDLVEEKTPKTMNEYRTYIAASIPFLHWVPVLFVSALSKQRVHTIFATVDEVQESRKRWMDEKKLADFLKKTLTSHTPMKGAGTASPKILGITQVSIEPPTFNLIVRAKRLQTLHDSYLRFLSNRLQETFELKGTSVRIHVRAARSVAA